VTTFDFVLLLVIAEATQQALIGDDFSVTKALLVINTLIGLDIAISLLKERWLRSTKSSKECRWSLSKTVNRSPIACNAPAWTSPTYYRQPASIKALEHMDEIKFVVLERTGEIFIVPKRQEKG